MLVALIARRAAPRSSRASADRSVDVVVLFGYPAAFARRAPRPGTRGRRCCGSSSAGRVRRAPRCSSRRSPAQPLIGLRRAAAPAGRSLHLADAAARDRLARPPRPAHLAALEHRAHGGRRRALDLDGDRAVHRRVGSSPRSPRSSSASAPSSPPCPRSTRRRRADRAPVLARGATAVVVSLLVAMAVLGAGLFMVAPVAGTDRSLTFPAAAPPDRGRPRARRAEPTRRSAPPTRPAPSRPGDPSGGRASFGYFGFSDQLDTAPRGRPDNTLVMRVRASAPDFWRAQSFDTWDGRVWTVSATRPRRDPRRPADPDPDAHPTTGRRFASSTPTSSCRRTTSSVRDRTRSSPPRPRPRLYFPDRIVVPAARRVAARRRAARRATASTPSSAGGGSRPKTRCAPSNPIAGPARASSA